MVSATAGLPDANQCHSSRLHERQRRTLDRAGRDLTSVHGSDPVEVGLVASLNRPGGNITGVNFFSNTLEPKRLELLHELVPAAALIAVLFNPTRSDAETQSKDVQAAARAIGKKILVFERQRRTRL
jgi:ABC-type uncharacterized transport system substrate-binding protein